MSPQCAKKLVSPKGKGKMAPKSKACTSSVPDEQVHDDEDDHGNEEDDDVGDDLDPDPDVLDEDDEVSDVADKDKQSARNKALILSDEVEDALVEWIQQNETLYDKTKKGYRKTDDKKRLWQAKAEELNITYKALMVWYKSQRTRYAKLLIKKSGQGAKMLTDREKWILDKWSFLKMFITRQQGRVPSSVSTCVPKLVIMSGLGNIFFPCKSILYTNIWQPI